MELFVHIASVDLHKVNDFEVEVEGPISTVYQTIGKTIHKWKVLGAILGYQYFLKDNWRLLSHHFYVQESKILQWRQFCLCQPLWPLMSLPLSPLPMSVLAQCQPPNPGQQRSLGVNYGSLRPEEGRRQINQPRPGWSAQQLYKEQVFELLFYDLCGQIIQH